MKTKIISGDSFSVQLGVDGKTLAKELDGVVDPVEVALLVRLHAAGTPIDIDLKVEAVKYEASFGRKKTTQRTAPDR